MLPLTLTPTPQHLLFLRCYHNHNSAALCPGDAIVKRHVFRVTAGSSP